MPSEDSTNFDLSEFLQHEEINRKVFSRALMRVLEESGFVFPAHGIQYNYLQHYLGIDKAALWRVLTDSKKPEALTLMRWCHSLYLYRRAYSIGTPLADQQMFADIMALAGYTMPQQINAARQRLLALMQQEPPQTDPLGDMSDPHYRETVQKTIQEAQRQFKRDK